MTECSYFGDTSLGIRRRLATASFSLVSRASWRFLTTYLKDWRKKPVSELPTNPDTMYQTATSTDRAFLVQVDYFRVARDPGCKRLAPNDWVAKPQVASDDSGNDLLLGRN